MMLERRPKALADLLGVVVACQSVSRRARAIEERLERDLPATDTHEEDERGPGRDRDA